jgi:hypothetical protein
MPDGRLDLLTVAAVAAGALFMYAGIRDVSVLSAIDGLVKGTSPAAAASAGAALGGSLTGTGQAPEPGVSSIGGSYSASALGSLWVMAGGDPARKQVAVCIAQHESGGNAGAESDNPDGGTNVGLWQLDTPGGKGAGYTVAQLKVALTNARVAVRASRNGTDWSAWSTAPMCGV